MIRTYRESDLPVVMKIWLDTNIKAHSFISKEYWISNYDMVKKVMPNEDDDTKLIDGFIGLTDSYIAGLFVKDIVQSKGIGKQLLDYVKRIKSSLC